MWLLACYSLSHKALALLPIFVCAHWIRPREKEPTAGAIFQTIHRAANVQVLQAYEHRSRQRRHTQHLHVVATKIARRDGRTDHFCGHATHIRLLVARVVLDPLLLLLLWWGAESLLLWAIAVYSPGVRRQCLPMWRGLSLAIPHKNVRVEGASLLSLCPTQSQMLSLRTSEIVLCVAFRWKLCKIENDYGCCVVVQQSV